MPRTESDLSRKERRLSGAVPRDYQDLPGEQWFDAAQENVQPDVPAPTDRQRGRGVIPRE